MKRSGPPRPKSTKRAAADRSTAELRALVASRPCLLIGVAGRTVILRADDAKVDVPTCAGPGTPHHLEKSSAGGATTPDNLVPLCSRHNTWVEDEPGAARLLGLVVRPGLDPAEAAARRLHVDRLRL